MKLFIYVLRGKCAIIISRRCFRPGSKCVISRHRIFFCMRRFIHLNFIEGTIDSPARFRKRIIHLLRDETRMACTKIMGGSATVIFARGNNLIALSRTIINGTWTVREHGRLYCAKIMISIGISRVNNNKSAAIRRDSSHLPD